MLKRASTVAWWVGVLLLVGFALAEIRGAIGARDGIGELGLMLLVGACCGVPFWALSYILGGTFWRPATGPLSKPAVKQ